VEGKLIAFITIVLVKMKTILDFVIIGAQKSGTTTLFKLLKQHCKIYLPPEKEVPFFGKKEREEKGWSWYLKEFYAQANEDVLWGSITPQYMCYPDVAVKIYAMNPSIKIIAILRDPYERAFSHYLMSKRRDYDQRNFLEAIKEQSKQEALKESRQISTETNSYVVRGEYARILSEYKEYFSINQMLMLFTSDLESNPNKVIEEIFAFLNIEKITPVGLGTKFHKGGGDQKIKLLTNFINKTRQQPFLKAVVRSFIPFKQRRRLWHKIDKWNFKPIDETVDKDEYDNFLLGHQYLTPLYDHDADLFKKEFDITVPWMKNAVKQKIS
jgi:hypothetical protein